MTSNAKAAVFPDATGMWLVRVIGARLVALPMREAETDPSHR